MMCAADPAGQDSCQGDSGGPLYDSSSAKLVEIVSFSDGKLFFSSCSLIAVIYFSVLSTCSRNKTQIVMGLLSFLTYMLGLELR